MSTNGTGPDQLEADIERQRAELAATIDQLHARLDVRTRVKDGVTTADGRPRPELVAAAVAVVLAGLAYWRRRR